MPSRVSIRLWLLLLLLTVCLDVLFARLGWTMVVVVLTSLLVSVPLAAVSHLTRETMNSYGVSAWDAAPTRPLRRPDDTPAPGPSPAETRRASSSPGLPDIGAAALRAAVLLVIATMMTP